MFKSTYHSLDRKLKIFLIAFIKGYRFCISPLLGQHCRFYPSCSRYAEEVIRHCDLRHGIVLTVWRLLRCHPFHPGGYDPARTNARNKIDGM